MSLPAVSRLIVRETGMRTPGDTALPSEEIIAVKRQIKRASEAKEHH